MNTDPESDSRQHSKTLFPCVVKPHVGNLQPTCVTESGISGSPNVFPVVGKAYEQPYLLKT